jgi:hypothetical protein
MLRPRLVVNLHHCGGRELNLLRQRCTITPDTESDKIKATTLDTALRQRYTG